MKIILELDDKKLQRGFVDIQKANQISSANTINTIAFLSRKNAVRKINEEFIIRNTFVPRNIRVEKAIETMPLNSMQSSIGATDLAGFMELQEHGGIRRPKRGSNLAIPQINARSGSKRRVVSKQYYLKQLRKQSIHGKIKRSGTSRSNTVARAYAAYKTKKYFSYKNNIYQIVSFTKSKNNINFRKKHIYNIQHKNPKIKSTHWLSESIQQPVRDAQSIYNSQIKKLLKKSEII